jgi:hypothetical protein
MAEGSPQEIARLVEFGEINAFVDMFNAAPTDFATEHGLHVANFGGATAFTMRGLQAIIFNRIIGLGLEEPVTEPLLDAVASHFEQSGIHHWAAQLSPVALTPDLPTWLEIRGLQLTNRWAQLYRDNAVPAQVNTDLRVKRVEADEAETFATTWAAAYESSPLLAPWLVALVSRPGWHHYLAYDNDTPIATGSLYVKDDVGWLGLAGTLPAYRKRGGQSALIAARLRDGLASGCRWFVVETGDHSANKPNPSYLNLERMGFRLAYMRPNYEIGLKKGD